MWHGHKIKNFSSLGPKKKGPVLSTFQFVEFKIIGHFAVYIFLILKSSAQRRKDVDISSLLIIRSGFDIFNKGYKSYCI